MSNRICGIYASWRSRTALTLAFDYNSRSRETRQSQYCARSCCDLSSILAHILYILPNGFRPPCRPSSRHLTQTFMSFTFSTIRATLSWKHIRYIVTAALLFTGFRKPYDFSGGFFLSFVDFQVRRTI